MDALDSGSVSVQIFLTFQKQFGVTMFEYPIMVPVFGDGEAETPIQMSQVDSMMSGCTNLHFSPNGNMLASSSVDGRIRIVDTEDGR